MLYSPLHKDEKKNHRNGWHWATANHGILGMWMHDDLQLQLAAEMLASNA